MAGTVDKFDINIDSIFSSLTFPKSIISGPSNISIPEVFKCI